MATINPPAWMQAGSYPARNDRLSSSLFGTYPGFSADEAFPLRTRSGVKPSYQNQQLKVRAAGTPNMTVIVSGGMAYIDSRDTGGSGLYACANDADVTLTVAAAGGAGQYRKDTVVASVYDAEYAGALSQWSLEVIQGPYAASAGATVRGTLPTNCVPLADLAIAPSQTSVTNSNITDVRVYTVAEGGIVPITASTDMARPAPGQVRYRTDTDTFVYGKADGTTAALLDSSGQGIGSQMYKDKNGVDGTRQSNTLALDADLQFSLAANAKYTVEGMLYWSTTDATNSDFTVDFQIPSGAVGRWIGHAQPTSATSSEGIVRTMTSAVDAGRDYGATTDTANPLGMALTAVISTTSAGTYGLLWARTGGSGIVTLYGWSWMALTRRA
ncbi:hypothetical protein [Streptomyces sp. NBC_00582]|uniref:hypothetical protein n=1 Tax=Streptomyces sp. NBC_00582 TaxID=2975783 RepID=UPI002E81656A|nr:hypothetical protein [Streptomyces sp. NBC_00582]WUB63892.1 hypothetical protein OG852_27600 [Streptomyces sp. NBC_00582]